MSEPEPQSADALPAVIARARREGMWARALPGLSVASALSALMLGLGLPAGWAAAPALSALLLLWRPRADRAVARLDRAAHLDGALICAADHQQLDRPIILAQRARALNGLAERPQARAWARPHLLWAALPLLWIWPLRQWAVEAPPVPPAPPPVAVVAPPPADDPVLSAPIKPPSQAEGEVAKGGHDPLAQAPPEQRAEDDTEPDAGLKPLEEEGLAGGQKSTQRSLGDGVGAQMGDQKLGRVKVRQAGQAPERHEVAQLSVARGGGALRTELAEAWLEAQGAQGRSPSDEALADPARPYPHRYRAGIQRWLAARALQTDRGAP